MNCSPTALLSQTAALMVAWCVASAVWGQQAALDAAVEDFSSLQSGPSAASVLDDPAWPMPDLPGEEIAAAAKEAFAEGRKRMDQGDTAGALAHFGRAVAIEPSFALAYYEQGRALASLQERRLAMKSLNSALAAAEDVDLQAAIHTERGKAYFGAGEFHKALDDFDRAAQSQPVSATLAYHRGRALRALAAEEFAAGIETAEQTMAQALVAFDRAIQLRADFAEAFAERAAARAEIGEIGDAIEDLQRATQLDPEDASLTYRLAVLHLRRATAASNAIRGRGEQRRSDLETAIELLGRALDAPSKMGDKAQAFDEQQARLISAAARIDLAALLEEPARRPHYEQALAACDQAIAETPESGAAHFQRGIALRLLGRLREAVAAFSEAIRRTPENVEARIRRGIAWFYLDEYDLAMNDFQSVGVLPGDPRPMFWIGVIHAQRGEHVEAVRAYSEAIAQSRRYRLAYVNRALSLMHLGHFQRAIDDWNELIQFDPRDAEAYYRRGLAQQRLGRAAEARSSLVKARQIKAETEQR